MKLESSRIASISLLAILSVPAAFEQSQTTLSGNVAPWVGKAQKTVHSDSGGRVVVSAYLKLRNESGLKSLIRDLYTPGNARYRKFLTPEEFRAQFSPSASDIAAVQ